MWYYSCIVECTCQTEAGILGDVAGGKEDQRGWGQSKLFIL